MVASMGRRNSLAVAREDQRGPARCSRSVGSNHPAKANALLAEVFMTKPRPNSKLGAALLLALWALFLLSAMVIAWALNINSRLSVSANANRVLSAEAMAASGAEVALARE